MDFFEDITEVLRPTNEIVRIYSEKDGDWAELRNGDTYRLNYGELENLRRQKAPYVAASPGHYVINPVQDDDGTLIVYKVPVIAWCIDPSTGPAPVTYEGVNGGKDDTPPVLFPDGQIQSPHHALCKNLDDFIQMLRDEGKLVA